MSTSIYPFWAMLLTSYLFYIDEGYYNFDWTKNVGNWITFVFYSIVFTSFLWLIHFIISKVYNGRFLPLIVFFTFLMTVFSLIFGFFKS
ncbi:MAG: hypothetical protein JNL70_10395 [Saprospiraceae bacterium]|nr:hypothetical protein [Saprospiraceae bacterium]